MSEALFYILPALYSLKIVFHFIYLSKADRLMGRYEKMTFFEGVTKYVIVILPVFVSDPAHSHFKKELNLLKWINIFVFLGMLVSGIVFFILFIKIF